MQLYENIGTNNHHVLIVSSQPCQTCCPCAQDYGETPELSCLCENEDGEACTCASSENVTQRSSQIYG